MTFSRSLLFAQESDHQSGLGIEFEYDIEGYKGTKNRARFSMAEIFTRESFSALPSACRGSVAGYIGNALKVYRMPFSCIALDKHNSVTAVQGSQRAK